MPKVSVVIPAYNSEKYIAQTIDSVLEQTFRDYEIIVVDDGSTDKTAAIVKGYEDKVKYFFQENWGTSVARNTGVKNAKGKYIAFLDNDDLWFPDKLSLQINIMEANSDVGMIFTDGQWFDDVKIVRLSSRPTQDFGEPDSWKYKIAKTKLDDGMILKGNFHRDFLRGNFVLNSSVLVRRKILDNVGLLDDELLINGDYDLWLRIAEQCPVIYLNKITTQWRVRQDSLSGDYDIRAFNYKRWDGLLFEKYSKRCSKENRPLVRRKGYECYKIAAWGYLNYGDFNEARRLSIKGILLNPFDLKLYYYILVSLLCVYRKVSHVN